MVVCYRCHAESEVGMGEGWKKWVVIFYVNFVTIVTMAFFLLLLEQRGVMRYWQ